MSRPNMPDHIASLIGEQILCAGDQPVIVGMDEYAERMSRKRSREPSGGCTDKYPSPMPEDARLYQTEGIEYDSLPAADQGEELSSISEKALVKRRLAMISSLQQVYQKEYWRLLEELKFQYNQGSWRVTSQASAPFGVEINNGSLPKEGPSEQSLEQQIRAQRPVGMVDERPAEVPSYSDAEAVILDENNRNSSGVTLDQLKSWKEEQRQGFRNLERWEQAASATTGRELDALGAIACFSGRQSRLLVKQTAATLGRSTDAMQVDIDLGAEGDAKKISRLQATLTLDLDGKFRLTCAGKRFMRLNHQQMNQGETAEMGHLSLLEVGGVRMLFMINHGAVERILARPAQAF